VDSSALESRLKENRIARSRNILVRAPNHLGDCIMAQPSVRAFAELLGEDRIVLIAPDWAKTILGVASNIEVIAMPSDELHGLRGVAGQIKRLKKRKFELGVVLPPSFSSAAVFSMLGVERRFGFTTDGRKLLINCPVKKPQQPKLHRMHQYQMIFEYAAGWKVKTEPARIEPDEEAIVEAAVLLDQNGIDANGKYIVIAPQAVAESRRWGIEKYASLARKLIDKYKVNITLMGTKNESSAGEEIRKGRDSIANLCGATDIAAASAVLSKASLFVGNDSGLAHLAAASGVPVVVLSGADDPEETSPMTPYKTVVIKDELECISCVKNVCPLSGENFMRCMKDISVDEVFEAASFYLEG